VFASDHVNEKTLDLASERGIEKDQFDEALLQFIFHLTSCEEAAEVFSDMQICPVCSATNQMGIIVHKPMDDMLQ
jgi:hypothetical protein